jgi:hypothetical protein
LFAAAGLSILWMAPLIWDEPPPGIARAKPLIVGLVVAAAILLAVEWLGVH